MRCQPRWAKVLLIAMLAVSACSDADSLDPEELTTTTGVTAPATTGAVTDTSTLIVSPSSSTTVHSEIGELVNLNDWIVYQGITADGSDGVFLVHPDGTGGHEIGDDVGGYGLPDWSPDGTKVVFTTRGGATEPLFEYNLATGTSSQLFDCCDPCVGYDEPSYSFDGASMVFVRYLGPFVNDAPSDCGLWIGDLATGEQTQLTSNTECAREWSPRLSPDGTKVTYYREGVTDAGLSTAVFVFDVASGEETQLTDWDTPAGFPVWSPDGEWIVYTTYPLNQFNSSDYESDLYRMRPDGSDVELLLSSTATLHPNQPRYTPDGEWILFTGVTPSAREIWTIPSEGGEPVALVRRGIHTHPAQQPTP